jgi:dTDP-4-amino-4,6-dideoxygalactose transaminase
MYDVEEVGFKYHGNSIMAAIGLVSLRYLDRDNAFRRQLADWYTEQLRDAQDVRLVPVAEGCESSRHLFQIRINRRDEVMLALHEAEIFPGVHYRDNTQYRMYAKSAGRCKNAYEASKEILSLPMHMGLTHHDVCRISDIIKLAVLRT